MNMDKENRGGRRDRGKRNACTQRENLELVAIVRTVTNFFFEFFLRSCKCMNTTSFIIMQLLSRSRAIVIARSLLPSVAEYRIPAQRISCRTFTRSCECADGRRSVKSRDSQAGTSQPSVNALRKSVLEEVAIPGKYRAFFNPDKRAVRKSVRIQADPDLDSRLLRLDS